MRRTLAIAALCGAGLLGCVGGRDGGLPEPGGDCAPLDGVYEYRLTQLGDDCSDIDPFVEARDGSPGELPPECSGTRTESADHCTITADDVYCPIVDRDGTTLGYTEIDGRTVQVDGPARVEGRWNLCFYRPDMSLICCGAYAVTAVRL